MPFILPTAAGPQSPFEQNRQFLLGQSATPAPSPAAPEPVAVAGGGGGGLAPAPAPTGGLVPQGPTGISSTSATPRPTAPLTFPQVPTRGRISPTPTVLGGSNPTPPPSSLSPYFASTVAASGGGVPQYPFGRPEVAGFPNQGPTRPIPKSSGGATGGAGPAPAPVNTSPPPAPEPGPASAPFQGGGGPRLGAPNLDAQFDFSQGILTGLTRPIYQGVEFGQQTLRDIGKSFSDAAGPGRTFTSAGGPGILQKALDPTLTGTAETQALESARGLLSGVYAGPQGLDQQKLAGFEGDLSELGERLAGLNSGAGLVATLQTGAPGLTPGMARYDAQDIMQQPGYNQARLKAGDALQGLQAKAIQDRATAEQYAKTRAEEEKTIAKKSRDFLTGRREGVLSGLDQRVQETQAEQDRVRTAYDQLLTTGDLNALFPSRPLQAGSVDYDELQKFRTPEARATEKAVSEYWRIAENFPDIKNVPPLELTINDKGNEKYSLAGDNSDEEVFDSYKKGKITLETFEQLKARQELWEKLGFSFGTTKSPDGSRSPAGVTPRKGPGPATVAPLYFGANPGGPLANLYKDPDLRSGDYFSLDEGTRAARENLSTKDERFLVNRVNSLLNEVYRLEEAGEPFRAAQVAADADRFLEDVAAEIAARNERGTAASQNFITQVNAAQRRYSKAKRSQAFGAVARIAGAVATGGATEVGRQTPVLGVGQRGRVEPILGRAGFNTFT